MKREQPQDKLERRAAIRARRPIWAPPQPHRAPEPTILNDIAW